MEVSGTAIPALPGLDLRPAGRIHQQPPIGGDADEHLAQLAVRAAPWSTSAAPCRRLAGADDLDPAVSLTRELGDIARRHQADQVVFAARDDGNSASPLAEAIAPIIAVMAEIVRRPAPAPRPTALRQRQPRQRLPRGHGIPGIPPAPPRPSALRSGRTWVSSRGMMMPDTSTRLPKTGFCDLEHARRRDAQRLLFDSLAAAAQYAAFPGIDQSCKAALELLVNHVAQILDLKIVELRQLRDDLDFNEEPRIHQTLHLHPGGGRKPLFVVILEPQIGGFQQRFHAGRIDRLFDHLVEAGTVRVERAAYVGVGGRICPAMSPGATRRPF